VKKIHMPTISSQPHRLFAYIIRTVDSHYRVTGCVPWFENGKVFFGPCKKRMRPEVREGDYIMGISGSTAPHPRRVLLWMRVEERLTFRAAWERGDFDPTFRKLRGMAMHIRPRRVTADVPSPDCYEHVHGAPHGGDWKNDVKGDRDVFLVGDPSSWLTSADGPEVTSELLEVLRGGITWKGEATLKNPLTNNARGKHVLLTGKLAEQVIRWMPKLMTDVKTRRDNSACERSCSCK
jgi:hypothetical protein